MANPYAPPRIDFSPLANLGETFFSAYDRGVKRRQDEEAPGLYAKAYDAMSGDQAPSATVPQTMPLAPLGQGAAPTFAAGGAGRSMTMPADPALAPAIKKYAQEAGLDPVDVATAMSYETGGTFDPWKAGPTTKWGQHRGLIQWGEPQAAQYGVSRDTPVDQQVAASIKYLRDRGVKPGMGLMDIYSAINAGSVGRYNASDAAAGGAPGTVADKVNSQMGAHREKAMALLGLSPADVPGPNAQPAQGFVIPGQGGMAPAQAASGPQPVSRDLFNALAANPNTRALAGQILASRLNPQSAFDFQTVGDQLVRVNKKTGAAEVVPGITKQQPGSFMNVNGRVLYNDPNARTSTDVTPSGLPAGARPMTDEERAAYQVPNDVGAYVGADGKPGVLSGRSTTVNVDAGQKGESKFEETLAAKQGDRWNGYIAAADDAQTRMADIEQMRELSRRIGSQGSTANGKLLFGPYLEAAGINVDGLSDLQVYDSLVKRLAPQMRAPGSGSTSDVEYKGFISAIGPLSNNPVAREMILDTFEAASRNDLARGEIATRLATKEITRAQAEKELRALPSPMQAFREFRKANPDLVGQAIKEGRVSGSKPNPSPTQGQGGQPPVAVQTPADAEKLPPGTIYTTPDGRTFKR